MIYTSPKGIRFDFSGWNKGERPTDRFDCKDWLGCLHGCMLALNFIEAPIMTHLAIADDGILHELLHLELKIDICTETTMAELRTGIANIEYLALTVLKERCDS